MNKIDGPMNSRGRDLRMTLRVRATTPGDATVGDAILDAIDGLNDGEKLYAGKALSFTRGDVTVDVQLVEYAQTWDGDTEEVMRARARAERGHNVS